MINLLTFIGIFILSWLMVGGFRKWSERRAIVDVPNVRSSHNKPTPVGGGLVIVLLVIISLLIWEASSGDGIRFWAIYVGAAAIALISWLDDLNEIAAPVRFAVHIAAASLAVWQMALVEEIVVMPGIVLYIGSWGIPLTVLWIVWLTNAYNFMDGIDGLAGTQSVVAAAGWAVIGSFFGIGIVTFLGITIMAASLGFLVHNWPPAKVFMGDVGSAFLGFAFAVLPLIAISEGTNVNRGYLFPAMGLAFVWMFFADTVNTLFKRLFAGDKIWSAHRKHLYQELVKSGQSHLRVTLLYGALMILVAATAVIEAISNIFGVLPAAAILAFAVPMIVLGKSRNADKARQASIEHVTGS